MAILSDLNLRLDMVNPNDVLTIFNTDTVKQSLIRLVNTEVEEVWDYRAYGLDLKQFMQYPLNRATATEIESYIVGQIKRFEPNVTYIESISKIIYDFSNNSLYFQLVYQLNATGEIINLPTLTLIVNR